MANPKFFLDEVLVRIFDKGRKPKRKADPDYGKFRRLCKKNHLTYTVYDGMIDIETPDGARFAIGQGWDQRLARLEDILKTGYDTGNGKLAWPTKAENNKCYTK
tara:strand:- start:39 stop:350 length:312 start_codon:yes stop_codon:yes gene_type:complete